MICVKGFNTILDTIDGLRFKIWTKKNHLVSITNPHVRPSAHIVWLQIQRLQSQSQKNMLQLCTNSKWFSEHKYNVRPEATGAYSEFGKYRPHNRGWQARIHVTCLWETERNSKDGSDSHTKIENNQIVWWLTCQNCIDIQRKWQASDVSMWQVCMRHTMHPPSPHPPFNNWMSNNKKPRCHVGLSTSLDQCGEYTRQKQGGYFMSELGVKFVSYKILAKRQ